MVDFRFPLNLLNIGRSAMFLASGLSVIRRCRNLSAILKPECAASLIIECKFGPMFVNKKGGILKFQKTNSCLFMTLQQT